jgi:hypothetical protein
VVVFLVCWLLLASRPPAWALVLTLVTVGAVGVMLYVIYCRVRWIYCELTGHAVHFKKYAEKGYSWHCKVLMFTRPKEAAQANRWPLEELDKPPMQLCEDTLHQRLERLEKRWA